MLVAIVARFCLSLSQHKNRNSISHTTMSSHMPVIDATCLLVVLLLTTSKVLGLMNYSVCSFMWKSSEIMTCLIVTAQLGLALASCHLT
jgi:hypothetical protein